MKPYSKPTVNVLTVFIESLMAASTLDVRQPATLQEEMSDYTILSKGEMLWDYSEE